MFAREQPLRKNRHIVSKPQPLRKNRHIVSKPTAATKGPAMAAPNQRPLGDISNLVGGLNAQCNIKKDGGRKRAYGDVGNLVEDLNAKCNTSKDGVRKRSRENLVVNANKGASSSTQQSQGEGFVVRVEEKAGAGIVWGNKRSRTIKTKAQYAISVSDSIDSSAQYGGLKAKKPISTTARLTARSEGSFRDVPSIDDGDIDNQLAVVAYVEEIYHFYRKTENMSCVTPDYIRNQPEIKEIMRGILIDWLIEVHLKFELMPETLYLTVNIIDRYLSIRSVTKKELQLVGSTAMLIASKYEEIWPLKVKGLLYISGGAYTSKQIVDMEHTILNQLEYKLTVPTPYVFLVRFLKAAGSDKVMENLAFFLVDLCLLHYLMIKYIQSMLAAAAVYTGQCTLKKHTCWSKILTLHTGYSEADLKECAHFMVDFHLNAERNRLKAVHKKYSYPFFGSVASLSPANLPAGTVAAPATDSCAHDIYFRKPY